MSLYFKCAGHTFVLRWPKGKLDGADEAIQSWVDNPEVDFTEADKERLRQKLTLMVQNLGL